MMCPTLDTIAQWALGDLEPAEVEAFQAHYLECDACLERALHMQRFIEELHVSLPPHLTVERRHRLETRRAHASPVDVQPTERARMRLGPGAEVGCWILHAPLETAARVDLEARDAHGGLILALPDVPFDPKRGEVVLACQVHYRALPGPREMHVRLLASEAEADRDAGTYVLEHEFEPLASS